MKKKKNNGIIIGAVLTLALVTSIFFVVKEKGLLSKNNNSTINEVSQVDVEESINVGDAALKCPTIVSAKTATYNGSKHYVASIKCGSKDYDASNSACGGQIQYKKSSSAKTWIDWATNPPSRTNSCTLESSNKGNTECSTHIYVRVVNGNKTLLCPSATEELAHITVAQANSSVTCKGKTAYTGNDIQSYTASSGCTVTENGSAKEVGKYTVKCTGNTNTTSSDTYKNYKDSTCTFEIIKGNSSITCNSKVTYDGKEHQTYSSSSNCTPKDHTKETNPGTYTVTCTGNTNYNDSSCSFTIGKASSSISCNSAVNYDGKEHQTYSSSSNCTPKDHLKETDAGTYTVTCTGSTNYKDSSCSFTINKVDATCPTLTAYEGEVDNSEHGITVTGGSGGTIKYSTDNKTWSETAPTSKEAGTTTVYVKVVADKNHNSKNCGSSTIKLFQSDLIKGGGSTKAYGCKEMCILEAGSEFAAGYSSCYNECISATSSTSPKPSVSTPTPTPCPANTYGSNGSCTNCPDGYSSSAATSVSPGTTSAACKISVPAGKQLAQYSSTPSDCAAGTYASDSASVSYGSSRTCDGKCTAKNQYSYSGATSCSTCDYGDANSTHTGCLFPPVSNCGAGQYRGANSCETCPKGYKCSNTVSKVACSGYKEYQDSTGQTSCKYCGYGKKANSTHTGCVAESITGCVIQWTTPPDEAVEQGKTWSGSFQASDGCTDQISVKASCGGGESVNTTADKTGSFSVTAGSCPNTCSVSVTSGNTSISATATVRGVWKKASTRSCDVGTICGKDLNIDVCYETKVGTCKNIKWTRCCGSSCGSDDEDHTPIPNPNPTPTPSVEFCEPTQSEPSTQKLKASKCEDNKEIKYTDEKDCNGYNYYSISCENTMKVSYDHDDDKDNGNSVTKTKSLFAGEGFKFGIKVNISRTCTGEFHGEAWKYSYNTIIVQIDQLQEKLNNATKKKDKNAIKAEILELINKLGELMGYVTEYNNYVKNIPLPDMIATVSSKYKVDGKEKTLSNTYEMQEIIKGTDGYYDESKTSTENLNVDKDELRTLEKNYDLAKTVLNIDKFKNPKNYKWYSGTSKDRTHQEVKFIFPKAYIDKNTGEVVDSSKNAIDGGNKIYTDYNTNPGTYDMTILFGAYGKETTPTSRKISISNSYCKYKVSNVDLAYRPIEITNPFINNKWKIGENWYNKTFNFMQTINSNTWGITQEFKSIILNSGQVASVQESNKKNESSYPYLGLCDRVKYTSQDTITKYICDTLNTKLR